MSFTIYYEPEGYRTDIPKLMGRHVAGASFLKGLFRHAESSHFTCLVTDHHAAEAFAETLKTQKPNATSDLLTATGLAKLGQTGGLFFPGPDIATQSLHRLSVCNNHHEWALCGITHTTSSAAAMDCLTELITSAVQPWDALICTSTAVKKNVEVVLQAQVDALRDRLGITRLVLPQLPVIPLGVHSEDFVYSDEQRAAARHRLGASEDAIVVLYVGRLSFHAKAHPLAMYQALENAARATQKDVVLVECGWHANDYIEESFGDAAKLASPSLKQVSLDGRDAENRTIAWAGADVVCSLSDNIQETFGIVPIEAMAAGLPVVVTDWDGYKDTIRDGVDGFRIPTIAPKPGLAGDLARRHALGIDTYDFYCGHSSALVAVHSQKLTQAFIELFQSPELRKKMGDAGSLRARQNYDWRVIIPRYEELWKEQTKMRLAAKAAVLQETGKSSAALIWPGRLDPTVGFASYPTYHLDLSTQLTLTADSANDALSRLAQYKTLSMVNFAAYVFPTDDEVKSVFKIAEASLPGSTSAENLLGNVEPARRPYLLRSLAWLCKLGLLQFR